MMLANFVGADSSKGSHINSVDGAQSVGVEVICGVLLDIAGVLYEGDRPVPGARQAFGTLVASGLPLRLVTNTTRRPKRAPRAPRPHGL